MGYYSEIHAQMQEDGELEEENHPTPDEMENNMTTNGEKYENTKGFFTEYSKSTASEDMAEVYSHMIYLKKIEINQIRKTDPILNNKISYIENKVKQIDNSFTFK